MLNSWSVAKQFVKTPGCRGLLHSSSILNATESPVASAASSSKWTPHSLRTGLIARKRGMTAMWDEKFGARFPVTVLQLENCQVTANITTVRKDNTEYHAVQVAATDRSQRRTTKAMKGHFERAGVMPKSIVREFPVTADAHIPVGTTLSAIHFVPGQYVDVVGKSLGKGFQGVMKRWNFKGLRASHGVSVSHRKAGAIGAHQDPGRVWPGKKMAGRMGGKRRTAQNLQVVRVDSTLDLIFLRGCVPGFDDAHLLVRDAKKKMVANAEVNYARGLDDKLLPRDVDDLPFPAGTKELAATLPAIVESPGARVTSPFVARE
ncbi:translation protein [Rickenella mellea]|uniref:Large ribosomal subunit protein uL3m n=1 Tax=Rickenella mellea TaxID=50990 RepID=A0A4Y7QBL6_9AGAM|nr:translation protein [Rickenella mellea]